MALSFNGSSQYLKNTQNLLTAFPFCVGMWVRPLALPPSFTSAYVWSMTDGSATPTNQFGLELSTIGSSSLWSIIAQSSSAGPTAFSAIGSGSYRPTVNVWGFVLGIFISAASTAIFTLNEQGAPAGGGGSASISPSGLTGEYLAALGASTPSTFANVQIAEFWKASVNPAASMTSVSNSPAMHVVRELAFKGPFSVPHVAEALTDYRAFDKPPGGYDIGDAYLAGARQSNWQAVGSPTLARHPSLRSDYARLAPGRPLVMI